jgi:hypothetical protein
MSFLAHGSHPKGGEVYRNGGAPHQLDSFR